MTTITMHRSGGLPRAGKWDTVSVLRRIYSAIARRSRIRADRRTLASLPDYLLRDIGISRSDIESATLFSRSRYKKW